MFIIFIGMFMGALIYLIEEKKDYFKILFQSAVIWVLFGLISFFILDIPNIADYIINFMLGITVTLFFLIWRLENITMNIMVTCSYSADKREEITELIQKIEEKGFFQAELFIMETENEYTYIIQAKIMKRDYGQLKRLFKRLKYNIVKLEK